MICKCEWITKQVY